MADSGETSTYAVPHNGVILSRRYCYRYSSNHCFQLYCQSNSTSSSVGSIIGDYSYYLSQSNCGAGCYYVYRFSSSWSYSYWSSYQGVYTCRIPDSTGAYLDVNVGIYPVGFSCKCIALVMLLRCTHVLTLQSIAPPRVTSFQRTSSTTHFTLSCYSTNSPATSVTWVKDDTNLTIDGSLYQLTQTVTYRRGASYTNTLVSTDSLDNVVGSHTCIVSNRFGSSSRSTVIAGGLILEVSRVYKMCLCNSYCTAKSAVFDLQARARGRIAPECE